MTREFLKNLGLEDSVIDSVLAENARDVDEEKQKSAKPEADLACVRGDLAAAQAELETLRTESAALREQLADRDYMDAVRAAVSGKGLKFSSKAAERDFLAQAKAKQMELKDGALTGFDDFVKEQQEADPYAFAPDKPAPRFVGPVGTGGAPSDALPANVAQAKAMGAARAQALKASSDAMKNFM